MRRRSDYPAYLALRAALGVARVLPRPAALAAGAFLGRAARALGMRRAVTDGNLEKAFPELPATAREALARRVYAHFGRMTVDSLRVSAAGAEALVALVRGGDCMRLVHERLPRGKGVILLTGHVGNWELGGAYLAAAGIKVAAVVKPPSNPYVARHAEAVRRRLGIETISMDAARSGVMAALAQNKAVALVADQGALRSSTFVPFFGQPTRTAQGPGLFAALSGAPVLFGALVALPDGGYELMGEVIEENVGGETREAAERIARHYGERLEALVRRVPEQYLWTHRLWKHAPPPPGPP
jgi:KDO2-lipid IV(A) lauroyltransferase